MSSRKKLKKSIKHICGELFADCCALRLCQQGNTDKFDQLMTQVLLTHDDFVARIVHGDKHNPRTYFKKLRIDFTERANALSEEIIKA